MSRLDACVSCGARLRAEAQSVRLTAWLSPLCDLDSPQSWERRSGVYSQHPGACNRVIQQCQFQDSVRRLHRDGGRARNMSALAARHTSTGPVI